MLKISHFEKWAAWRLPFIKQKASRYRHFIAKHTTLSAGPPTPPSPKEPEIPKIPKKPPKQNPAKS